jgi:hypothetical protein
MLGQGASPELLQQWKGFLDQGIEAWSNVLEKAMATETFASAFGKYMDQYVSAVGPMQKEMKKASEAYLRALGLPSRTQITEMTSQISWVETRIEELEAKIEQVLAGVASLQSALEAVGPREGRNTGPAIAGLPPFEVGLPLLKEGVDPFRLVLRPKAEGESLCLES